MSRSITTILVLSLLASSVVCDKRKMVSLQDLEASIAHEEKERMTRQQMKHFGTCSLTCSFLCRVSSNKHNTFISALRRSLPVRRNQRKFLRNFNELRLA